MPKKMTNSPSGKTRKISSLEGTVLGFAWLRGPCTIYAIMKELSLSASSFHKSRAGTAYSVANRLIQFGMLEVLAERDGSVRITPKGLEALRTWIEPPVPMEDVTHSADLVRLRFFFLGVLDQDARIQFIDSCIDKLAQFLRRCEELVEENEKLGDYFGALATVSSVLETRARIEWLELAKDWVVNPLPGNKGWAEAILRRLGNRKESV